MKILEPPLCIATLVRVLKQGRKGSHLSTLCEGLVSSIDPFKNQLLSEQVPANNVISTYSSQNYTSLYSAKQNLPEDAVQFARKCNPWQIMEFLKTEVFSDFDEASKKKIAAALIHLIANDETIDGSQCLGSLTDFTKSALSQVRALNFDGFLTDLFLLSLDRDNTGQTEVTKAITAGYFKSASASCNITLVNNSAPKAHGSIAKTTHGRFDVIFTEVSSEPLPLKVRNDCRIFATNIVEFEFDYPSLSRYLTNNLGYCILSRSYIKDLEDQDAISTVALDAIMRLQKMPEEEQEAVVGDLLLHVFLEEALGAPKLMSRVEIGDSGVADPSTSASVHLLTLPQGSGPSEFVLGTSMIEGNLNFAVDDAFARAAAAKVTNSKYRTSLEPTVFDKFVTRDEAELIREVIIPRRSNTKRPSTSFGIFLGYSIGATPGREDGVDAFEKSLRSQLQNDLRLAIPHIAERIHASGLSGFPVYVYVIPFKDAEHDVRGMLDFMLRGEPGAAS